MIILLIIEFSLLGVVGGLLGLFYRTCLKPENAIFNRWHRILTYWAEYEEYNTPWWKEVRAFIAYPLGYCIYCTTTWITFILCAVYLSSWEILPGWQDIVIGVLTATGMQHLIVASACRFLIHKHPDLDIEE